MFVYYPFHLQEFLKVVIAVVLRLCRGRRYDSAQQLLLLFQRTDDVLQAAVLATLLPRGV